MKQLIERIKKHRADKKMLSDWLAGILPDDQLTAEQREYIQNAMKNRMKRLRRNFRRSVSFHMLIRDITIKPIGRLLRPLPVEWRQDFADGVSYPHCPACHELAYEKDHCVFCGRRFSKWDDQTEADL